MRGVGFTTGATMANLTCLGAARHAVLADVGWDVNRRAGRGSAGAGSSPARSGTTPSTWRCATWGSGAPEVVAADTQGRIDVAALGQRLAAADGPTIVCLQAGNLHSGAFDPIGAAGDLAHRHGAWVHVDGAFGLWAAASPTLRHCWRGYDGADSWATDAHKTLNVPYDCGIAVVADPDPLCGAMGVHTSYLIRSDRTTRTNGSRSCPGGPEVSRSGPRCGRWGAPGSRSWWTGLPRRPVGSLRGSRRSTARRWSTTSSTRRCACASGTTSGPGRSRPAAR